MVAVNMLDADDPETTAFSLQLIATRPALQRFALRLTREQSAAEDLAQDTLTRAWGARARFQTGTNIKAWLFRIAQNAFISRLRRARRQLSWDPDRHPQLLVQAPTQEEVLYGRDLHAAFALLTEDQRCALALIADGLSTVAADETLGVPLGTLKSRVSRGRASLLASVMGQGSSIEEVGQFRRPGHDDLRSRRKGRTRPTALVPRDIGATNMEGLGCADRLTTGPTSLARCRPRPGRLAGNLLCPDTNQHEGITSPRSVDPLCPA